MFVLYSDLWYTSMSYDIGSTTTKSVSGSRWNFLAMCSRTRDMPGGYFSPPPVAGKRRKKTVAGTRVKLVRPRLQWNTLATLVYSTVDSGLTIT